MFNYRHHPTSLEDDFEYMRPKPTPPLPYSQSPSLKYHHNIYNQACQPAHLENTSFQSNLSLNETISKSVMFGIPRNNCPRPLDSRPSVGVDFHPANLGSPFVDITLNNCDDLSLYQPVKSQNQFQPLRQSYPQMQSKPSPIGHLVRPHIHSSHVQRTSSQIETPKPILKKTPEPKWSQNDHVQYNQNLYQEESLFKNEDNFNAEGQDSDQDESETVFSASLKDLKQHSKDWSIDQSSISQNKSSSFQYQSFMLDDESLSNNTSMNTRALAAKYLFKKDGSIVNSSTGHSLILPRLETQNLFKLYTPEERTIEESRFLNKSSSNSSSSSDSDEDVWLFGKPIEDSDKKKPCRKSAKDFSDQDSDIERDVTNILDIEKLKLLPKLL
ncbi:hypothetical protein BpHYR1_053755 [Brachionus plicatilis]|uniref:Uncharacterized protein n=1 Tax=Brachionus plicatilis TaxID=10195 RepID=A0A3M7QDP5_BRAPC|nr:hypothetical protein BpHYR1_053755 [Brachionus plicatilis]